MPTTILNEQRLPIAIQLLSRISTYAHVVESILAIIVFWVCPSLAPKMPAREVISPRHSISIHSLKSTTSTLVDQSDCDEDDQDQESKETNDEDLTDVSKKRMGNPFSKLSAPMTMSPSLSLLPFARRMSLPARRFSENFANFSMATPKLPTPFQSPCLSPLSNSFQTPAREDEAACYFSLPPPSEVSVEVRADVEEIQTVEETLVTICDEGEITHECVVSIKRARKFKRVTRKVKSLLRLRQIL